MVQTKQFFKKRGGMKYSVVIGADNVHVPEHNNLVNRTVIRTYLVTKTPDEIPKDIYGEAILNPIDNEVYNIKFGMNLAIDRAEKTLRGCLLERGEKELRGEVTRILSGTY